MCVCARVCVCVCVCVQNPDMLARLAHADVIAYKTRQLLANGPDEALQVCRPVCRRCLEALRPAAALCCNETC